MDVRAHMSMVFHLDKCIGCHTCSVACKNLWTDRKGAEYMWWNNVETRPGTGYPTGWEDQDHYKGGWKEGWVGLELKLQSRPKGLANLFHNPKLPELEDYYEPFTYRYDDLFTAPEGDDQPTAIPISAITGQPIEIKSGPNWDDDLSGSQIYAANDPNWDGVSAEVQAQMSEIERVVFNYLPRICNHCLNPACVAACPSGAIYKRGEDGVVLVDEDKCRAWRMCVSACPYKKVYYNWSTGKSEKCILCFPRMEVGQAPACAHSCVGRIRYMGVLLYDADLIEWAAQGDEHDLIDRQLSIILDPNDPEVIEAARASGIDEGWIESAQRSPAYKFVKEWGMALPLHAEYRTMAMMFYVPPLSPVVSTIEDGLNRLDLPPDQVDFELFDNLEKARLPIKYLANLFSGGNEQTIRDILRKMLAVRIYKRRQSVEGEIDDATMRMVWSANTTPEEIEEIYKLTTVPTIADRFVFPPYHREMAAEAMYGDPLARKGETGLGYSVPPERGA
ncbi:MAG: nitrate reductase subunit beta [Actinomycetota bacterium]|nr:nitrate reductase subunit beta [Actinomycetota bacterium]